MTNNGATILIVDDNQMNRMLMRSIFQAAYCLEEAENGAQALDMMRCSPPDIALLDIVMPVMDGYQVLETMQTDAELSAIPVLVVTANADPESQIRALELGAMDVILKPYSPSTVLARVRNVLSCCQNARKASEQAALSQLIAHQERIIHLSAHDSLTGLYNRDAFCLRATEMISSHPAGTYILSVLDIDHFQMVNEQYGHDIGDRILKRVADIVLGFTQMCDGIACRKYADQFAALYPKSALGKARDEQMEQAFRRQFAQEGIRFSIRISTGRYCVNDRSIPISAMLDRAQLAKRSIKQRYDKSIAVYADEMRERELKEQWIIAEMDKALASGQFEGWLQPQINHVSGALIGAEMLVRWRHPIKGVIPPTDFISVFESNGFIFDMDKYIWETACRYLRQWLDEGRALPVSVNVSRYDVLSAQFFDTITGLVEQYRIPIKLLCLEITESAFTDSPERIIEIVDQLRAYGFTVEIDDFGSGYSSLNTLMDVQASVLKLDMRFLQGRTNAKRGGYIMESVVQMAKKLDMPVIAEGVETKEQADYLRSIGCVNIQGYLYYKPLSKEAFEALLI